MHRQSLGSPPSKPQAHHAGKEEKPKEEPLKQTLAKEEEEEKGEKLIRCRAERLVHLIPLLLFLCLFILYFFSHDPTVKDLVKITGSGRFFGPGESLKSGKSFGVEKKGDVISAAVIYSHRSLQQIRKNNRKTPSNKIHRKFGDF